jgi:hypothetical protein
MPARKKPVINRKVINHEISFASQIKIKFAAAATKDEKKNTLDAENLSAIVSKEKINVPAINPN